jgi:hypothetical protein
MRSLVGVVLLASGTVFLTSPAAFARADRSHFNHHAGTAARPPARIACTVLGCQPIPAECMPVPGRTPGGLPTGYDVIVCPRGIWPLR